MIKSTRSGQINQQTNQPRNRVDGQPEFNVKNTRTQLVSLG